MELLPSDLRDQLPKLYETEGVSTEKKIVRAKFFFPAGNWTWFVVEGEEREDDFIFFGYVIGLEEEWGYFSLRELQEIDVHGLSIERDLYFEPTPFKEVITLLHNEKGIPPNKFDIT